MKRVKVSRFERKMLHEVLPPIVLGPLRSAAASLDWLLRTKADGFTPGEQAALRKELENLRLATNRIHKVYFRTKF